MKLWCAGADSTAPVFTDLNLDGLATDGMSKKMQNAFTICTHSGSVCDVLHIILHRLHVLPS